MKRSVGIVDQVRIALSPAHRLATCVGALLGAVVPLSVFMVLHLELEGAGGEWAAWYDPRWLIVVGGLLYSASTVYRWGRMAFSSWYKALGFTALIEGVMSLSDQLWLSVAALAYLCLINAIATGVTLARGVEISVEPAAVAPVVQTAARKRPAAKLRVVAEGRS